MEALKKDNRQYNAIDVMKFIMAFLVVMIHKPIFLLSILLQNIFPKK